MQKSRFTSDTHRRCEVPTVRDSRTAWLPERTWSHEFASDTYASACGDRCRQIAPAGVLARSGGSSVR